MSLGEGKRNKKDHKKLVCQLSTISNSIACSPIAIENRFLCLRNAKKEAVQLWSIGKELGLKSDEKEEVIV